MENEIYSSAKYNVQIVNEKMISFPLNVKKHYQCSNTSKIHVLIYIVI